MPTTTPPAHAAPDPLNPPATLHVTTPAQASALMDFAYGARLLEQFLTPATASHAARALNEPANRVTYHVRKLVACGLLRAAGHQGKRVLYVTAARTFHVPRTLVQLDEPLTVIGPAMREITAAYAHAILDWQTRQGHPAAGDDLTIHLGRGATDTRSDPGAFAPAMRLRTVQLSPQQYRARRTPSTPSSTAWKPRKPT
ncbi:winged helix-turn-helix domain-containing protein [Deinococcus sp. JMULE3]|uniref:winged helix-turn-helix domain-containing protein n=1 Tax=Deinococcus sp. JMULE3 TaxID=2518341 RepID=UPI0015773965|nr:winged helix-turn-helix domain-containing protein [Deinococcus sp. JMULE3]NTX99666.1 ArsR family transcriptional regulator [Deinococcus sp. JMULE3]